MITCGRELLSVMSLRHHSTERKLTDTHSSIVLLTLPLPHVSRCLAIHPTKPLLVSASDDGLIKLWNWEKVRVYGSATYTAREVAALWMLSSGQGLALDME